MGGWGDGGWGDGEMGGMGGREVRVWFWLNHFSGQPDGVSGCREFNRIAEQVSQGLQDGVGGTGVQPNRGEQLSG